MVIIGENDTSQRPVDPARGSELMAAANKQRHLIFNPIWQLYKVFKI